MKRKWLILSSFLASILILFSGNKVYAAVVHEVETIALKSKLYSLDSYQSYMESSKKFMSFLADGLDQKVNGLANIFFDFNKLFFMAIDKGLEILYVVEKLDSLVEKFGYASQALWLALSDKFQILFLVVGICYISYVFFFKSAGMALGATLKMVFIIGLGLFWYGTNPVTNETNSTTYIKQFNKWSLEVQAVLMTATDASGSGDAEGEAVTKIRNSFFSTSVEQPYYLMNYGTSKEADIKKPHDFKFTKYSEKIGEELIDKKKDFVKSDDPQATFISGSKAGWKLSVGLLSGVTTLGIGIPMLIVAFLNVLITICVNLLGYVFPFALVLGILPFLSNTISSVFGALVGLFMGKAGLGIITLAMYGIFEMVEVIIPAGDVGSYLLQVFCKVFALRFAYKKREKIFKLLKLDKVYKASEKVREGGRKAKEKGKEAFDATKDLAEQVALMSAGVPPMEAQAGKSFLESQKRKPEISNSQAMNKQPETTRTPQIEYDGAVIQAETEELDPDLEFNKGRRELEDVEEIPVDLDIDPTSENDYQTENLTDVGYTPILSEDDLEDLEGTAIMNPEYSEIDGTDLMVEEQLSYQEEFQRTERLSQESYVEQSFEVNEQNEIDSERLAKESAFSDELNELRAG